MQSKFIVIHTGTKTKLKERLWHHCQHTTKQWNILWFKLSCSKFSNLDWNYYIFKCLRQEQFYTFKQTLQKAVFGNVICLSLQGSLMIFLSRKNYIFVVTSSWILLNCMVVERLFGNICCMLLKIYIYKKHEELKEQSYSC